MHYSRRWIMRFFSKTTGSSSDKVRRRARKGCVAVYVGEEAKRYEVPVKYLSFPVFRELLMQDHDDGIGGYFDPKVDGPLKISCCTTSTFDQLMKIARQHTR
ncbi:putative SAUR-like auxin-responsive protein family [Tripterygium wilfordii]|uniref:Putative SAUR-like auxin-responsive protein family n=1 Tax=Tripterygium wilfordii TaxID=458696 RepID=A0A7J7CCU7_TRIWF|nr:putative SAUR-like auxin-responsive protein family [Tripterygium wilfordii]